MGKLDSEQTRTIGAPPAAIGGARAPELADVTLPSRFTPLRILGAGAMGYVVAARDESLGREVAVKVIAAKRRGDARSRNRFLREARAVAALRHANIVTVHDLDPLGKFLVMELVYGETLKDRIARDGALPAGEVRRIGGALLAALATAHGAGIIHRDVKPANVLLGHDGSVKLADFGVAATSDSELTDTGEVIGTPAYMAPEQLRGHGSDPRVDIYAAGATLYEAATGVRLHRAEGPQHEIADAGLAAAIARAVSERPADRFGDAASFAAALAGGGLQPRRPARTKRVIIGATLAVATAAAVGIGIAAWPAPSRLELGIAALERQEFAAAEEHLRAAGDSPEAHYYTAILYWWTSHATPEVRGELDKALAGGLGERLAETARGVRALVDLDYPDVIDKFAQLDQRYPNDRDVLYGRFEALFHGGRPDEAMAVYRRLRAIAPRFGLARHHALDYWVSRGDTESARWALVGADELELARWEARIHASGGDFEAARRRLELARAEAGGRDADALGWELAAVEAGAGDVAAAHQLAVQLSARDMRSSTIPLLGLGIARGSATGSEAVGNLWRFAVSAAGVPASILSSTRDGWVELATLIVIDGNRTRARTALDTLKREVEGKNLETDLARALLSGVVDDREALGRSARGPFPEVRAVAEALLADDPQIAAAAWQRALAANGFARFRIAESLDLARALAAAHRHDDAITACEAVIRPRLFHWSWGAAIGECLQITASAHRAAGRVEASRAASRRLLELRAAAPADDPLATAARANVAP